MRLRIKPKARQPSGTLRKLDLNRLKDPSTAEDCNLNMVRTLTDEDTDPVAAWQKLTESHTLESAINLLGTARKKHQDWFDDNDTDIQVLLDSIPRPRRPYVASKEKTIACYLIVCFVVVMINRSAFKDAVINSEIFFDGIK